MTDVPQAVWIVELPLPDDLEVHLRPAEYRAFFERFNAGKYFEAHEVLEAYWLRMRGQPIADFYKALIQLAGVFVHLEKGRPAPAQRLLARSADLLQPFPSRTAGCDLEHLRKLMSVWREHLEAGSKSAIKPASLGQDQRPAGLTTRIETNPLT
jgi:predicted metal-dependent hydrolase